MGKKTAKASTNGKANGNGNGANLGFEAKLWLAADKLCNDATAKMGDGTHRGL